MTQRLFSTGHMALLVFFVTSPLPIVHLPHKSTCLNIRGNLDEDTEFSYSIDNKKKMCFEIALAAAMCFSSSPPGYGKIISAMAQSPYMILLSLPAGRQGSPDLRKTHAAAI